MTTMQLHAALIWGGEPIANVLLDKPGPITIGPVAGTTFTIPDLGLPEKFAIVSPGERGYLLTMGREMAGTVSIGGVSRRVTDLVGEAPFAATPVAAGDWGVVDLDASGGLQLFFQVAPTAEKVAAPRTFDLDTLLPATAFSVVLHLLLLIATFVTTTGESPFTWPGPRSLTGAYLVTRIEPPPPPPPLQPVVAIIKPAESDEPMPATQVQAPRKDKKPDHGREGTAGGPRVKPDATEDIAPDAGQVGLNSPENRELIRKLTNSPIDPSKWTRKLGPGVGRRGEGPGGKDGEELPGDPKGDDGGVGWKPQGKLDTEDGAHGRCKKGDKKCKHGKGDGDGDGTGPGHTDELILPPIDEIDLPPGSDLDPREIQKRIRARQGLFRQCFQRELNRNAALGGTIVPRFTIAPDGTVTGVKIEKSTVQSADVGSCVQRQLRAIRFPTSSEGGVVRYPLVFSGGDR